jgi:hypothetical protein
MATPGSVRHEFQLPPGPWESPVEGNTATTAKQHTDSYGMSCVLKQKFRLKANASSGKFSRSLAVSGILPD